MLDVRITGVVPESEASTWTVVLDTLMFQPIKDTSESAQHCLAMVKEWEIAIIISLSSVYQLYTK